jgi:formylglycine-generating enzyme required for sulfatase activity
MNMMKMASGTSVLGLAVSLLCAITMSGCGTDPGGPEVIGGGVDVDAVDGTAAGEDAVGDPGDADVHATDADSMEETDSMADEDTDTESPPDVDVDVDEVLDSDDADVGVETERIGCADLSCADEGRACVESEGDANAECGGCLGDFIEVDAECVPSGILGAACNTDSQCPNGTWCSTVSGFRRCSPRLFAGQPHQMDFVYVPAGTFEQGTPGETNEERPYTATLTRNYFVSRTEVTQGQWRAATDGINPSCFQSVSGSTCTTDNNNDDGPVERVDWYAALAYANWLSGEHGLQTCYALDGCNDATLGWHRGRHANCTGASFAGLDCTGYRLLTESEWERAARGGTTTSHYWGEGSDTATLSQYAWFADNSGSRTQGVGQKVMNAYGLYDMSGNVREWVWDWVHTSSAWIPYPSGSATDYLGGPSGTYRGQRGGDWRWVSAYELRTAGRLEAGPSARGDSTGVRLARTVP